MLCFTMPTGLVCFRYVICIFCDLMEFRRFAHGKNSQSDAGMNLAFFKFGGNIGSIISIANHIISFVHAASALGGTCTFTWKILIVNTLTENSSRDDRLFIST